MTKSLSTLGALCVLGALTLGCSTSTSPSGGQEATPELGQVGLPLSSVSSSGVEYRLRNAEFSVWGYPSNCWETGEDCEYYSETFSSEDYLEEPSIMLDLMEGDYEIYLNPGWQLEKIVDGGEPETVDAVLLNGSWQWAWVSPHSTSWVSYQFGIGDAELWLNGQLNIEMQVYEDPEEYYGSDPNCTTYCDEFGCYDECCVDYCDELGCWSECWGSTYGSTEEVPTTSADGGLAE